MDLSASFLTSQETAQLITQEGVLSDKNLVVAKEKVLKYSHCPPILAGALRKDIANMLLGIYKDEKGGS